MSALFSSDFRPGCWIQLHNEEKEAGKSGQCSVWAMQWEKVEESDVTSLHTRVCSHGKVQQASESNHQEDADAGCTPQLCSGSPVQERYVRGYQLYLSVLITSFGGDEFRACDGGSPTELQ